MVLFRLTKGRANQSPSARSKPCARAHSRNRRNVEGPARPLCASGVGRAGTAGTRQPASTMNLIVAGRKTRLPCDTQVRALQVGNFHEGTSGPPSNLELGACSIYESTVRSLLAFQPALDEQVEDIDVPLRITTGDAKHLHRELGSQGTFEQRQAVLLCFGHAERQHAIGARLLRQLLKQRHSSEPCLGLSIFEGVTGQLRIRSSTVSSRCSRAGLPLSLDFTASFYLQGTDREMSTAKLLQTSGSPNHASF